MITEQSISYLFFLDQCQCVAVDGIEADVCDVDDGVRLRHDVVVAPEFLGHPGNRTDTQSTVLNPHWPHTRTHNQPRSLC